MASPFFDHELEILDGLAREAEVSPELLRSLLEEATSEGTSGRIGLRRAIERHLDGALDATFEFSD